MNDYQIWNNSFHYEVNDGNTQRPLTVIFTFCESAKMVFFFFFKKGFLFFVFSKQLI